MTITNYDQKIELYLKSNPHLNQSELGVLLLIDNIYRRLPTDIGIFRKTYAHLDPSIIDNTSDGIIFLEIVKSKEPTRVIKHRLNSYINIKFNSMRNYLSYNQNMKKFSHFSTAVSSVLDQILQIGRFPSQMVDVFGETDEVRNCVDFYRMLELYRNSPGPRVKYEILRKIGLIVLMSRMSKTFLIEDIDYVISEIEHVFHQGLGLKQKNKQRCFLWIDKDSRAQYTSDKKIAFKEYQQTIAQRSKRALPIYSMQVIEYTPYTTRFNSDIQNLVIRNKLRTTGDLSSASYIEKVIRKNIEFPKDIHDMIGVKIVVGNENSIPMLVKDLANFLGGSSTRKKEKNTLFKFGKRPLSKYSSKDYFVWKAVYDIALPHPYMSHLQDMLNQMKDYDQAAKAINQELQFYKHRPRDYVVEVQIQDFNSYLLSIAKGSPTDHEFLKKNQIRQNSFYKLFPKEIYESELMTLRNKILGNGIQTSESSSSSSSDS